MTSEREQTRAAHRRDIRTVQAALSSNLDIVFMGGKVMSLYAKSTGDRLRPTNDVDALVAMDFGALQAELQTLMKTQVLSVDIHDLDAPPCRYTLVDAGFTVDIVDLDGRSTGEVNPYHRRAVETAAAYDAGEGVFVRAITPPFFLLAKLVSLRDAERTSLDPFHHDAEDIVSIFVEVDDVAEQVDHAGVLAQVQAEFGETLRALHVRDPMEFLDLWLREDAPDRARIVRDFLRLCGRVGTLES
jgi:hypothetical protein